MSVPKMKRMVNGVTMPQLATLLWMQPDRRYAREEFGRQSRVLNPLIRNGFVTIDFKNNRYVLTDKGIEKRKEVQP